MDKSITRFQFNYSILFLYKLLRIRSKSQYSSFQRDMDKLPSTIVLQILSNIPIKSLARFWCVSKVWCEYIDDPYLAIIHRGRDVEEPTPIIIYENPLDTLPFHIIHSKAGTNVLDPKKDPTVALRLKTSIAKLLSSSSNSCNGLLCLSRQDRNMAITKSQLVVIHPLRKEYYKLPYLPFVLHFEVVGPSYMIQESCGLGFDDSTNTYKMVCLLLENKIGLGDRDLVR